MSPTTVSAFEKTLEKTHVWLNDLQQHFGWNDSRKAWHTLGVVLHALRDRLTVEETADLGAQLPMLIRGLYYEGWTPAGKPLRIRTKEDFLAPVSSALRGDVEVNAEQATCAVFQVVARHVTAGEIEDVKRTLPEPIRRLWDNSSAA